MTRPRAWQLGSRRFVTWRPQYPRLLLAAGGLVVVLALAGGGHGPTDHGTEVRYLPPSEVVLTAANVSGSATAPSTNTASTTTATTSGAGSSSSEGPPGIQVGPGNTTTPTTPAPGSGGAVSGGTQSSPGLFSCGR
jgi:hypothetical protein